VEKVPTELHRREGLVIRLRGTLAVHDIGQAGDGDKSLQDMPWCGGTEEYGCPTIVLCEEILYSIFTPLRDALGRSLETERLSITKN